MDLKQCALINNSFLDDYFGLNHHKMHIEYFEYVDKKNNIFSLGIKYNNTLWIQFGEDNKCDI